MARHLASVQVSPPRPIRPGSRATLRLRNRTKAKVRVTEFQDGRRLRWEGSFLWLGLGYDHLVTTDNTGRVRITFTVDGAGVGVNTIGLLFASIYARNLDRATSRLQALRRPVPLQPGLGGSDASIGRDDHELASGGAGVGLGR